MLTRVCMAIGALALLHNGMAKAQEFGDSVDTSPQRMAARLAEVITALASYDVKVDYKYLAYSKDATQSVVKTEQCRDVFAFGIGRRFEIATDKNDHTIVVKKWGEGPLPQDKEMSYRRTGMNYFDYYNPSCGGMFLSEVLSDPLATVRAVAARQIDTERCPGLEIENDGKKALLRVWVSLR